MRRHVLRITLLAVVVLTRLWPQLAQPALASQWGSSYGDPAGFCPEFSYLPSTYQVVVTNDPSVPNNPEQSTFWGIHQYPGYDDWYGYWYGDYAGIPGDQSGWVKITTSYYGQPAQHWNFSDYGWQVHGHVKQYIAYYNWTFGGDCGFGWYGRNYPAPYMADVYGYPVVDFYVDSTPPYPPQPKVAAVTSTSVTFTWDPVQDRGDGAGADYFAVGMGSYTSWVTVGSGSPSQQATTQAPRMISVGGLTAGVQACVHVVATDLLGNATTPQSLCATPFATPPAPAAPGAGNIGVAPAANGLAGLASDFWLRPVPEPATTQFSYAGYTYRYTFTPAGVDWTFGDGAIQDSALPGGAGEVWPLASQVTHAYQAQTASGYQVEAQVLYQATWAVEVNGSWLGPYPAPPVPVAAPALTYPVEAARPELISTG